MAATLTYTLPGGSVQLTGNPILINATSTRDNATNLKVICEVKSTEIPNFPSAGVIDEIAVDANDNAVFNISELVDMPFPLEFNEDGTELIVEHPLLSADVSIRLAQAYIDTETGEYAEDWPMLPFTVNVIKGGLSKAELAKMASLSQTFYSKYVQGKRFLTKAIDINHNVLTEDVVFHVSSVMDMVKLWFCFEPDGWVEPLLIISYTDNSQSIHYQELANPSASILYELNAHVFAYQNATEEKTVSHYMIQLSGGQTVWVYVDNRYYENHNILLFENSFGCVEAIHCFGELVESSETTGESYTHETFTPSLVNGDIVSPRKNQGTKFKLNSGIKKLFERRWMREALGAPHAWLISPRFNNSLHMLPVTIPAGSTNIDTTSDDLLSIDFNIEVAYFDKYVD